MKQILFILFLMPLLSYGSEIEEQSNNEVVIEETLTDNNFNFRVNVLGLVLSLGDLSLEYKVHPNITVSGSVLFGKFTQESTSKIYEFDIKTFGGNIKATYYLSAALKDSFFISASAGMLDFDVKLRSSTIPASSEFSSAYIGANLGYAWHWKHLNINIGAGYNHSFEDDEAKIKIDNIVGTTTVQVHYNLVLEAALGVTF